MWPEQIKSKSCFPVDIVSKSELYMPYAVNNRQIAHFGIIPIGTHNNHIH